MNHSMKVLIAIGLGGLLIGGCASKFTEESQYSGFLPNYDGLQETTSASGQPVLRWVAEGFDPEAYDTVVFNQLELYPTPKPNERINLQTLRELQSLTSSSTKRVLAKKYTVVADPADARPGARTLILNAAITGVSASDQDMQWYEIMPIAAVAGAASSAAGYRDQDTELYLEVDLVDATTGQPVMKAIRKVLGSTLKNSSQAITADDFKLAIKGLADDVDAFINNQADQPPLVRIQ